MATGLENKFLGFSMTAKTTLVVSTHYIAADNILFINWVDANNTEMYFKGNSGTKIKFITQPDSSKTTATALMESLFALNSGDADRIVATTPLIQSVS